MSLLPTCQAESFTQFVENVRNIFNSWFYWRNSLISLPWQPYFYSFSQRTYCKRSSYMVQYIFLEKTFITWACCPGYVDISFRINNEQSREKHPAKTCIFKWSHLKKKNNNKHMNRFLFVHNFEVMHINLWKTLNLGIMFNFSNEHH